MQGKFPRTALIISSFMVLSLSTSAVLARSTDKEAVGIVKNTGGKSLSAILKRKEAVSLPGKVPVPIARPKKQKKVKSLKSVPKKKVVEKKLPSPALVPVPVEPDFSAIQKNVQETVKELKAAEAPRLESVGSVNINESHPVTALGFATSSWEDSAEGFRFHAAAARRIMTEGRPDLATSEIALAKENALKVEEISEVDGLLAVADVLMGKEVRNPIAPGEGYPSDWKAVEVARASISGEKPIHSVIGALDEVSNWPDPLSALIIRHYAPLVDKHSANILLMIAERLNAAGALNQSVLPLVRGFKYKIDGDYKKADTEFEKASTSVLGGVSGRAKLELLEAKLNEKSLTREQIVATATDIVNIKTADYVERRALRILADNVDGVDKINTLRKLEKLEFVPAAKALITQEIDKLISDIAVAEKVLDEKMNDIPAIENKAGKQAESEQKNEARWLLDEEVEDRKSSQPKRVSIKSIKQSLSEVGEIVRSFEEVK